MRDGSHNGDRYVKDNWDKLNEEERHEIVSMDIAYRNVMDLIKCLKQIRGFQNKKLEDLR